MEFRAAINVMPLKEILDPQGKAVVLGLGNLGLKDVKDVRTGKHITLDVAAASREEAEAQVDLAYKKMLANLSMESYEFSIGTLDN